ncbi:MAG: hypothetical protein P1U42_03415 [Phycisphaerales bacterium]|nr:hypothetical protein [Phycisphaerales bacterium]
MANPNSSRHPVSRTLFAVSSVVTIASLMLASGCASSQQREASSEQPSPTVESTESVQLLTSLSNNDEFVIGKEFINDSVPQYRVSVKKLTLEEIQEELEEMYELDRELVDGSQSQRFNKQSTIREIDQVHGDRLKEIVAHIGWPTRELVGLKATQAAYMVIQHTGHDIEFQNQCLALMVDLVEQGELPASYVALLTDRIRFFQGQPQVFGTQMAMISNEYGMMVPTPTVPIEDPENLDQRRALMGMPAHSEFVGAIQLAFEASQIDSNSAFAEVQTSD